jgi:hypothetical protein
VDLLAAVEVEASVASAVDPSAVAELVEAGNRIENLQKKQVALSKKGDLFFLCPAPEINLISNPDLFD